MSFLFTSTFSPRAKRLISSFFGLLLLLAFESRELWWAPLMLGSELSDEVAFEALLLDGRFIICFLISASSSFDFSFLGMAAGCLTLVSSSEFRLGRPLFSLNMSANDFCDCSVPSLPSVSPPMSSSNISSLTPPFLASLVVLLTVLLLKVSSNYYYYWV